MLDKYGIIPCDYGIIPCDAPISLLLSYSFVRQNIVTICQRLSLWRHWKENFSCINALIIILLRPGLCPFWNID